MQELNINVTSARRQHKGKCPKRRFMDKAVIYCLFMCTVLDAAILTLYWHSMTAPDSLAIAAMAAPWMVEFGAMASIKNKKPKSETNNTENEGE